MPRHRLPEQSLGHRGTGFQYSEQAGCLEPDVSRRHPKGVAVLEAWLQVLGPIELGIAAATAVVRLIQMLIHPNNIFKQTLNLKA